MGKQHQGMKRAHKSPTPFWILLVGCCIVVMVCINLFEISTRPAVTAVVKTDSVKLAVVTTNTVSSAVETKTNNKTTNNDKIGGMVSIKTVEITKTTVATADNPKSTETVGFLVKNEGCRIPDMPLMDISIRKYIFREEPIVCNNGTPPLFDSNHTAIYLVKTSLQAYEITTLVELKCCYTAFHRTSPTGNQPDKFVTYEKDCISVSVKDGGAKINKEFIKLECSYHGRSVYQDFFSFVPTTATLNSSSNNSSKLNILLIGLDAISRLNFNRQMPKTVNFLRQHLSAIELFGYNKVADNTFPNLIPVLTGLSEAELTAACWPHTAAYFDQCPFIWRRYWARGYVTAFAEDAAWMGLFNYQKKGFLKEQPTTRYWDHFNMEAERWIGNGHRMNVNQCVGGRRVYRVLLDYIEKFATASVKDGNNYLGLFWQASLSHDYLNKPQLGDNDYYELFGNLEKHNLLNNTVLVVMSDHGIRWGGIRTTFQGRMEERLPFLYLVLPDWVKQQFPHINSNLVNNQRRLTTPYDLHKTLEDFLQPLSSLTNNYLEKRSNGVNQRSYSLLGPIPTNRTCSQANIPPHFCTCQRSDLLNSTETIVQEVATYTVNYINKLLANHKNICARLYLYQVINARISHNRPQQLQDFTNETSDNNDSHVGNGSHQIEDITITISTRPGDGVFEATIRKTWLDNNNINSSQQEYKLETTATTISRINLYGKQSYCMDDFHLKLFCYCKDTTSDNDSSKRNDNVSSKYNDSIITNTVTSDDST